MQDCCNRIARELGKVVVGQLPVIEGVLASLLAGGHILLEGVPGTAKTLIVKALAMVIGGEFKRIQFTPDMMPSDITGTQVFDIQSQTFRMRKGPVFTNVLLADEVNRTPPKTQAALLEAMEERHVTIDGEKNLLPAFFIVLATQNPVEYEGTYPLPEAQLDRFLVKLTIDYPQPEEEQEVLRKYHEGFDAHDLEHANLQKVIGLEELPSLRQSVRKVVVEEAMFRYIYSIVAKTRESLDTHLGGSPRASIGLLLIAKALAAMRGRNFIIPEDVKDAAPPVLRHRMILRPEAEIEGITADQIIKGILDSTEVPR
ncbi:MAG: MoxR family ATPase [Armatimonadetes bacterium]|nr:MoxR family ATPase [Armatimonadota bacterium]